MQTLHGDLDPMTLIYEHDLDILKMYPYTTNELSRSRLSKIRVLQKDRRQIWRRPPSKPLDRGGTEVKGRYSTG